MPPYWSAVRQPLYLSSVVVNCVQLCVLVSNTGERGQDFSPVKINLNELGIEIKSDASLLPSTNGQRMILILCKSAHCAVLSNTPITYERSGPPIVASLVPRQRPGVAPGWH